VARKLDGTPPSYRRHKTSNQAVVLFPLGGGAYPVVRRVQKRFGRDSAAAMLAAVRARR
jgi:putative hemolysin